jgi:hypothetical protein
MKKITDNNKYFGLIIFFILLIINFISNYSGLSHFGLYEDDYWYVANSLNQNTSDLLSFLGNNLLDFENGEGRIIGKSLPLILIHIIYSAGGFKSLFIAGLLLVTLNSFILFSLLKKQYNAVIGFLAAVIFMVFPTDTTRPFLTHIYQLQLSLLFIMISFVLLSRRRYFAAYLFALFSLLTYENAFLPFIFAPFLISTKWDREFFRTGIRHLVICAVLVAGIFFIRKLGGEDRIASLSMVDFTKKTLASTVMGPAAAMFSIILASVQSSLSFLFNGIVIIAGAVVFFISALWLFHRSAQPEGTLTYRIEMKYFKANIEINEVAEQFLRLFLVSAMMLMAGYLFAYTHYPPSVIKGRMASVHFASSISGAIFIANISYLAMILLKRYKVTVLVAISLFLGLLMGYSNLIQRDYKKAWASEQAFWKEVSTLVNDAENNTLVLISSRDLDSTVFIQTHSWAVPLVLTESYQFPVLWDHPPKVKKFRSWQEFKYDSERKRLFFLTDYPFMYEQRDTVYLEDHNTVFLVKDNDKLVRKYDSLTIGGQTLYLKPKGETVLDYLQLRKTGQILLGINKN